MVDEGRAEPYVRSPSGRCVDNAVTVVASPRARDTFIKEQIPPESLTGSTAGLQKSESDGWVGCVVHTADEVALLSEMRRSSH